MFDEQKHLVTVGLGLEAPASFALERLPVTVQELAIESVREGERERKREREREIDREKETAERERDRMRDIVINIRVLVIFLDERHVTDALSIAEVALTRRTWTR